MSLRNLFEKTSGASLDDHAGIEGVIQERAPHAFATEDDARKSIRLLPRENIESIQQVVFQQYSAYMALTNLRIIFLKNGWLGGGSVLYIPLDVISGITLGRRIWLKYGNISVSFGIKKEPQSYNGIDDDATRRMFERLREEIPDAVTTENKLSVRGTLYSLIMVALVIAFIGSRLVASFSGTDALPAKEQVHTEPDPISALRDQDNARSPYWTGILFYRLGEYDKALEQEMQAIKENPFYAPAHAMLGAIFLKKGDLFKASDYARQAIGMDANSAMAHSVLGQALIGMGKEEEGREEIRKAEKIGPGDPLSPGHKQGDK